LNFYYDSAVLAEVFDKLFIAKFLAAIGNRFRFAGADDVDPIADASAFLNTRWQRRWSVVLITVGYIFLK